MNIWQVINSKLYKILELVKSGALKIQSDWSQSDNTKRDFIKNKPTIPAAQIQADWNQSNTSALDYIKNKPAIPATPVCINGLVSPDGEKSFLYIFTPHSTCKDDDGTIHTQMSPDKKQEIANAVKYGIPIVFRLITTATSNDPGETITATQNYLSYDSQTHLPSKVTLSAPITDGHWGNGKYVVQYEFTI